MIILFELNENDTVFAKVSRKIQQLIFEGKLKKGDKLPSERELAKQFGISRNILREALRSLSLLGLIESRQGDGNYITADFDIGLLTPLSLLFKLENGNIYDVVIMRYVLDVQAAKMAAFKSSNEDLATLRDIVNKTKPPLSKSELVDLEIAFHTELSRLSNNMLMHRFTQAIFHLMKEQTSMSHENIALKGEDPVEVVGQVHYNTLKAIENKDGIAAAKYTAEGFEDSYPQLDFSMLRQLV